MERLDGNQRLHLTTLGGIEVEDWMIWTLIICLLIVVPVLLGHTIAAGLGGDDGQE